MRAVFTELGGSEEGAGKKNHITSARENDQKQQDSGSWQKVTPVYSAPSKTPLIPKIVRKWRNVLTVRFCQVKWPLCLAHSPSLYFSLHPFQFTTCRWLRNHILYNVYHFGLGCSKWSPFFAWGILPQLIRTLLQARDGTWFFFASHQFRVRCGHEMKNCFISDSKKSTFAKSHAWGRKVVYPFLYEKKYFNLLNHGSLATFFVQPMTS